MWRSVICLIVGVSLAGCGRPATTSSTNTSLPVTGETPLPGDGATSTADKPAAAGKVPPGEHPLDPVLKRAEEGLARFRKEVDDYTCTITRHERINGKLADESKMSAMIRNRKMEGDKMVVPLSVKLKFIYPAKGREVFWVEGANEGKLHVNEPLGLGVVVPVWLKPDGAMAMKDSKYPIMDIGIENLLVLLIERGGKDRADPHPEDLEVTTDENVECAGRACSRINIRHIKQRPEYDFKRAEIYIDTELDYPIRYAAYNFPTDGSDDEPLEEEYTHADLKLNVGLDPKEFEK